MDNSDKTLDVTIPAPKAPEDASLPAPKTVSKNGKRIGRPPKKRLAKSKPGPRKGDAAILAEYRERMLISPKSQKVLEKVFDVALEDGHAHQAACMKMIMDRIVPAGAIAGIAGAGGGKSAVTINITGIGEASVEAEEDTIDAEFEEV